MPSIANFIEVESVLQKALDAPTGNIRVDCGSHGAAINLRQRLNTWRLRARKENLLIYPPDSPNYGISIYDTLSMRVPPSYAADSHYLYITRRKSVNFEIEELPPISTPTES